MEYGREEEERLQAREAARRTGSAGGHTSANAPGEPCAKTTAPAEGGGTVCPTTMPAPAPTAGMRTASRASVTASAYCFAVALWNGNDPILKRRSFSA